MKQQAGTSRGTERSDVDNVDTQFADHDNTTAQMIERIAAETAHLANRRAWAEILVKIRATGLSASPAGGLRALVLAARKRNAALNRASNLAEVG